MALYRCFAASKTIRKIIYITIFQIPFKMIQVNVFSTEKVLIALKLPTVCFFDFRSFANSTFDAIFIVKRRR